MKRILSLVMALCMIFTLCTSMSLTASAADEYYMDYDAWVADWDYEDGIIYGYYGKDKDVVVPTIAPDGTHITTLDKAEYGWGRGKAKKALIKPLVDNIITALKDLLGNYYDDKGYEYCEKIRDDIMKELDAHFYTNEKNIIVFFNMLLEQYETILNYRKKNS